ncbi:MAG: FAD-dependent oxidoreductase, partial [Pyrinomonadaceae bacterium]
PVVNLDLQNKSVTLADKRTFTGRSIVLATGVRRRRLGITGEAKFEGRGVLRSGVAEKASVAGKRVVIVGGGDAALENAIILSETASSVTIVHRRNEFLAREDFLSRAEQKPNIDFMKNTAIEAINGDDRVRSISISTDSGLIAEVPTDFVLVRIGVIPNNELFADTLKTDPHGYVIVDSQAETSVDDIFAVGDIANPIAPTISTATGTAATAIKTIESKSN